jgi:hypothetical protein
VAGVVLGDGLHTSYVAGNQVNPAQMGEWLAFAREATLGRKDFRFGHSAIVPGSYASTTECADWLIAQLGLQRAAWSGTNSLGMVQQSRCEQQRFAVHGFAGNQAADHVKHFQYLWLLLAQCRALLPAGADLPLADAFPQGGRQLNGWRDKFTTPVVQAFQPTAPGGDGHVLVVKDPAGGYESTAIGYGSDYAVEADLWCDYRPELAADGFERIGIFARDDGNGGFLGTSGGGGSCYTLTFDSHDGRVRCLRSVRGVVTELMAAAVTRPSSGWRRFRIEARGERLSFMLDGQTLANVTDASHPVGTCGIGYHEHFTTNSHMRGTRADRFRIDLFAGDEAR